VLSCFQATYKCVLDILIDMAWSFGQCIAYLRTFVGNVMCITCYGKACYVDEFVFGRELASQ